MWLETPEEVTLKLQKAWYGPCEIVTRINEIRKLPIAKPQIVHINHLAIDK